nr:reverse transcriptase domain-containing protein [Tanacetum cinerariifolium]
MQNESVLLLSKQTLNVWMALLKTEKCKLLAVASLFFWQWKQSSLAVGTYTARAGGVKGSLRYFGVIFKALQRTSEDLVISVVVIVHQMLQPLLKSSFKHDLVQTVGYEAAYGMSWKTLMKMMTDKYFPQNEIRKLEMELWELKVKGTDLASYTQRFQELALLCGRMFSKEADKIEKYVGGLPDMIHGNVVAS